MTKRRVAKKQRINVTAQTPSKQEQHASIESQLKAIGGRSTEDARIEQQQVMDASEVTRHEAAIAILRIQLLMAQQNEPLELELLQDFYQDAFGESLKHNSLGYESLESFVQAIPFVHMHFYGRNLWLLTVSPLIVPSLSSSRTLPDQKQESEPNLISEDTNYNKNTLFEMDMNRSSDVRNRLDSQERSESLCASNERDTLTGTRTSNVESAEESLFVLDYQGSTKGRIGNEDDGESLDETRLPEQDPSNAMVALEYKQDGNKQAQVTLDEVQKRIYLLVSRHSPLDIKGLKLLYRDSFHEPLDNESLGFQQLKLLVESVPSIKIIRVRDSIELSLEEIVREDPSQYYGTSQDSQVREHRATQTTQLETDVLNTTQDGGSEVGRKSVDVSGSVFASGSLFSSSHVRIKQEETNDVENEIHDGESTAFGAEKRQDASDEQPQQMTKKEARRRIQMLVSHNVPIDMSRLPKLYESRFNETLDYKSLGYGKFKRLVLTAIAPIGMQFRGNNMIVQSASTLVSGPQPTLSTSTGSYKTVDDTLLALDSPSLPPSDPCSYYGPQPVLSDSISDKKAINTSVPGATMPSYSSAIKDEAEVPLELDSSGDSKSETSLSPYDREVSRLEALVATHESNQMMPLELTKVPEMYKTIFGGERLYVRGLGFSSLEQFAENVPSLVLCYCTLNSRRTITVHTKSSSSDTMPEGRHVPSSKSTATHVPTKKKQKKKKQKKKSAFRCLVCGHLNKKWKKCRRHMKKCCPERLKEERVVQNCIVLGPVD